MQVEFGARLFSRTEVFIPLEYARLSPTLHWMKEKGLFYTVILYDITNKRLLWLNSNSEELVEYQPPVPLDGEGKYEFRIYSSPYETKLNVKSRDKFNEMNLIALDFDPVFHLTFYVDST